MNARKTHLISRHLFILCLTPALMTVNPTRATAETASQRFAVNVPIKAEVVAPPAKLVVTDIGEGEQRLPEQSWNLGSTSTAGMVAEFSVASAFSNQHAPRVKSDVGLSVRVAKTRGGGQWIATHVVDCTDHTHGDEGASVTVESTAGGSATVDLQVEFANSVGLPAGRYETTVFCTIATH